MIYSISISIDVQVTILVTYSEFIYGSGGEPRLLANVTREEVHDIALQSGKLGSTLPAIERQFSHVGVKKFNKKIKENDKKKYKVVYEVMEGDFSEDYTNFHIICEAMPNPDDGGTIVHWILEFEKPDEKTPNPTSMLEYLCDITKDIDAPSQEAAAPAIN